MERLPLTFGVVLLNEEATLKVGEEPNLNELANQLALGNARQVVGNIADFEAKFGKYDSKTNRFEKFTPTNLFILPEPGGGLNIYTKVIAYSDKNFQGDKVEYSHEKKGCGRILCPLELINGELPMSLLVRYTGPGIYLYGKSVIEEFQTRQSIADLRDQRFTSGRSVNDNVESIAIRNKYKVTDYGAILHEDVDYQGECRIFFTKRDTDGDEKIDAGNVTSTFQAAEVTTEVTENVDDLALTGILKVKSTTGFNPEDIIFIDNLTKADFEAKIKAIDPTKKELKVEVSVWKVKEVEKGALVTKSPKTSYTPIQDPDEYGKIDNPSSIHVFQIAKDFKGSVTLCPTTDFDNLKKCATFTKPIWKPTRLNKLVKEKDLEDEVRSIKVSGNFLVVLFDNIPAEFPTKGTGKCQVFGPNTQVPDLTKEPIGKCQSIIDKFWGWRYRPCASAIAIYPVK
jgi:hypothetical protein